MLSAAPASTVVANMLPSPDEDAGKEGQGEQTERIEPDLAGSHHFRLARDISRNQRVDAVGSWLGVFR